MPNDKPSDSTTTSVELAPDASTDTKRPNVLVRAARKIKNTPPRTAIAVGAGVALVSVGAFLGRKSAPYHVEVVEDDFTPEPVLELPDSSDDTTVA